MKNPLSELLRQSAGPVAARRLARTTQVIQRALAVLPQVKLPAGRVARPEAGTAGAAQAAGEFSAGTHSHGGLSRAYKLYSPPGRAGQALPLVVMLHGCTQDPDDFAAGTGMNQRAAEQGFYVLYPAQSGEANPQRCWNWFKHNHQQRDQGEPALIASLTHAVMRQHGIDERRVFIAGLSAGGAMADIVAGAYPELYAAVGVHSGLPRGAAANLQEALAAMNQGARTAAPRAVPTIVFHGDRDATVHPRNGELLVASAMAARTERGTSPQGRAYTRSVHARSAGQAAAEHWVVHGGGHAWSGGQAAGSYTDGNGPDATREMLRFFFEHPRSR